MAEIFKGRNSAEIEKISAIADTDQDGPVLMINLNRYVPAADFPNGALYTDYMAALNTLLGQLGARILWQKPVRGQPIGEQSIDEILAIWYPSHRAFLDLPERPGSAENFCLRDVCVAYAVIHRCPGD